MERKYTLNTTLFCSSYLVQKGKERERKGEKKREKKKRDTEIKGIIKIFIFICFLGQKSFFFPFVNPPHILTHALYVFHIFIFFLYGTKTVLSLKTILPFAVKIQCQRIYYRNHCYLL